MKKRRDRPTTFYKKDCTVLPAPLTEKAVFSPLYILASFIRDKVTICAWVYLWAFYPVPLIYISVFVPVPYWTATCKRMKLEHSHTQK